MCKSGVRARAGLPFMISCTGALLLMSVSCDGRKSEESITVVAPATAPATEPTASKVERIVNGPRKDLQLIVVPLLAKVPEGWGVKQNEGGRLLFLEGQGPTQLVQIQLARRPSISKLEFEARSAAITTETLHNAQDRAVIVRTTDVFTVVERTAIDQPSSTPIFDEKGNVITVTSLPFRWTVTFYHLPNPTSKDVDVFELNFVGLSAEQYGAEKDFLRGIIDSIRFDPNGDLPLP